MTLRRLARLLGALALVVGLSTLFAACGTDTGTVSTSVAARATTATGVGTGASTATATGTATSTASGDATDPVSGLPWIDESALPAEAAHTLAEIRAGGPYDYPRNDDVVYHNNNRALPKETDGYYREFTVKTPGSSTRGARRIIQGSGGELYYTSDHYGSFQRIREGQ